MKNEKNVNFCFNLGFRMTNFKTSAQGITESLQGKRFDVQ